MRARSGVLVGAFLAAFLGAFSGFTAHAAAPPVTPGESTGRKPWPTPKVARFPDVTTAIRASIDEKTAVVAFGELHQRAATAGVRSTLSVFTQEILPALAPELSHLVVETWLATGSCGEEEKAAVAEVEKTTERPKHVENELVVMLTRAKELGVSPQVLNVDCAAYKAMRGGEGQPALDFEKTLAITTDALTKKITAVLDARKVPPGPRHAIAVYGGALHNDLFPDADLAAYSFAPPIEQRLAARGSYVEIDLLLPALIDSVAKMLAKEPWFVAYRQRKTKREAGVLRIERGPGSYVIIPSAAALKAGAPR